MSVINSVLKDLETRESHFTPIEISGVESRATPRSIPLTPLVGGLLLLLLAALAWIYYQNLHPMAARSPSQVAEPLVEPIVEPIVEAVTAAAPPTAVETAAATDEALSANQIVGMQISESEQEMRMEFLLRDKVAVYLKQRGETSFAYHLRGIESQIVAPLIEDNPWIRRLEILAVDEGVDIKFQTRAEILVETRQGLIDGEPVWAIKLRQAVSTAATAPPPEAAPPETAPVEVVAQAADLPPEAVLQAAIADPAQAVAISESAGDAVPDADPIATEGEAAIQVVEVEVPVKLEIKSTDPNARSQTQLEYAVELMNSARFVEAETLLLSLLGGNQDYQARQHLLAYYGQQAQAGRFTRLVRESSQAYPADALFKTEYARALFQGASYRGVIQLLAYGSALNADQQALVAASYQRLDEHEDAVKYYRLALAQDAGNAKNWIGLAISQEHTAALDDALGSYQRAHRIGQLNSRLQAFVERRSATLRQLLN